MIPLAIDREQVKEDTKTAAGDLIGGVLGLIFAAAFFAEIIGRIDYLPHHVDMALVYLVMAGYLCLFAYPIYLMAKLVYDRYTVSEEAENPTKGDEG